MSDEDNPQLNVLLRLEGQEGDIVFEAGSAQKLSTSDLLAIDSSERLHQGYYSDVWKGTWRSSSGARIPVVVKVFPPPRRCLESFRFFEEDRRYQRVPLSHRFIQPIVAHGGVRVSGQYDGAELHAIISPFWKNRNLRDYLHAKETLSERITIIHRIDLALKIAEGINYMHLRTPYIAHGHIDPHHVLIDDEFNPRIVDFGLGRIEELDQQGRPPFDPDRFSYEEPSDRRGRPEDVFSFGRLAYFILNGKRPFAGETAMPRIAALRQMPGRIPRRGDDLLGNNDTLWSLLERCCDHPDVRPTMAEVVSMLRAERNDREVQSASSSTRQKS